jgi:hypothetical protein
MPSLTLNHELLQKLCTVNHFTLPNAEMIFVGLRGAIVADANDQTFKKEQAVNAIDVNYINPRCTIFQWRLADKQIAAFPASTVPHQINVKKALAGGDRANCLFTGFYKDYRKGVHKPGSETAHQAFRQNAARPFRRTSDDLDFDTDDRIEYDNPHDNIHCGWFGSLTDSNFASAGCQVVMGFPQCQRPGRDRNTGPWKTFHANAYAIAQGSFPYILVTGLEAFSLASGSNGLSKARLRFGSYGPAVTRLQQTLKQLNYYEGNIDGDFGERTMKAVINFQKKQFGNQGADGIVGPITAEELGISLSFN